MSIGDCIREDDSGVVLKIRIIPSASKSQIIITSDMIKIKVTAPPVENKANKALIEYLSKCFKIPKTSISIVKGETSKDKTLHFAVFDKCKKTEIINKLLNSAK